MKKIDPVVMKETMRILIGSIALGAIMNAVFLMLRCWNLPVLFGTLLGTAGSVLNFFLMAQTVSHSVTLQQDEVKRKVRFFPLPAHADAACAYDPRYCTELLQHNCGSRSLPFPAAHHRRIQTDSP